jgi:hypothetical protein
MKISFNLRLSYNECQDCIKKIKELGGDGNITVGGSWYTGNTDQINNLLSYMNDKNYDTDSMAINKDPWDTTQEKIKQLKKDGIIKS